MFGIGFQELLVIFLIVLLVFGARRLPEIGRALGRTMSEFRKGMKEAEKEFKEEGGEAAKEDDRSEPKE
ncbi:MAG TPA: twin-arginine translocase TatA/TatE family subunit [bacterium]|uniref:Sec-independent protein translocase protein TatA n=1 Tax=candidate division TA06 bacterium ADurb.Bin417 TaxID=1852828 RepID=A0A1V5MCF8_UNCT6|nr:MAG: Sec-independent protein translocase protein TatAd [candidate division TA06 bacterium ADurb.Bin417]HNS48853.1 twin-arginine translocase TatA/TatE family subunit [bacterium]